MRTENTELTLSANRSGANQKIAYFLRTNKIDWDNSPSKAGRKRTSNIMTKILLGVDITIFMVCDKDGNCEFVDDTLPSIKAFINNEEVITHKIGLLKDFDGKKFSELAPRYQNQIEDYEPRVIKLFLTEDNSNEKEIQSILELYSLSL